MITLVSIELYKIFKKWRSYIGFIAIAVLVPVIQIAISMEGIDFKTRNFSQSFVFVGNILNPACESELLLLYAFFNNSVKSITLKCNEGNGDACLLFANLLEETSPSFNVNLHKKHLSKACNMKNFAACLKLANTTPNTDKKLSSLKQLCMSTDVKSTENELAAACIGYYLPQLQKGHESLAFKNFIATRCETNKKTCSLLGLLYLSENNNTQYKTLIMEGCKAGIAHSCFELGMESLLTNDLKNSKNFLQQACSRGFSSACNVLKTLTIMNNDPIEDILQSECFTSPIICWYLGVKKACQGLKEPFSCISSKNHNSNKNLDNQ